LQADDVVCPFSLGCRHGLELIYLPKSLQILVWDPITGDQHRIALPPRFCAKGLIVNGAVLRDQVAGHAHFQVVLVTAADDDDDDNHGRLALACLYLSETGVWGDLISTPIPSEVPSPDDLDWSPTVVKPEAAVLVGDSLYWLLLGDYVAILEFDLNRNVLAVIQELPVDISEDDDGAVTRAESGGLGFLHLSNFSAHLWNRETDRNGAASWVLRRTVELDKLLSMNLEEEQRVTPEIIGFAECSNVVVLWIGSVFLIQLESLHFKKISRANTVACNPFESVYAAR
jgi:hypothetical protein